MCLEIVEASEIEALETVVVFSSAVVLEIEVSVIVVSEIEALEIETSETVEILADAEQFVGAVVTKPTSIP